MLTEKNVHESKCSVRFRISYFHMFRVAPVRFGSVTVWGCERFERFRFSVPAVPLKEGGFLCVSVQFNREGRFRFRFRFLENGIRRFRFRVRFLGKRFRRFRFRFLSQPCMFCFFKGGKNNKLNFCGPKWTILRTPFLTPKSPPKKFTWVPFFASFHQERRHINFSWGPRLGRFGYQAGKNVHDHDHRAGETDRRNGFAVERVSVLSNCPLILVTSGCAKGAAKGSCGETVVQKGIFGESVSSLPP